MKLKYYYLFDKKGDLEIEGAGIQKAGTERNRKNNSPCKGLQRILSEQGR